MTVSTQGPVGPVARSLLRLTACVAIGLTGCTGPSPAEAPDAVAVEGCPEPGVEAGCLMLRTGDGQLYDVTAATPPPALDGRVVRVIGRQSDEMSVCMQGIKLADITWTNTSGTCSP